MNEMEFAVVGELFLTRVWVDLVLLHHATPVVYDAPWAVTRDSVCGCAPFIVTVGRADTDVHCHLPLPRDCQLSVCLKIPRDKF